MTSMFKKKQQGAICAFSTRFQERDPTQDKLLCHQNQFAVFKPGVSFVPGCATDSDDPSTPNAELQHKILTQTPSQLSEHMFQMDSRTWAIYLSVDDNSVLDTSQVSSYHLIVQVKDLGNSLGYCAVATVEIAIVENTQVAPGAIFLPEISNVSYPQIISKVQWQSREVHYSLKGRSPQGFIPIYPARNIYATLELDRESQHEIQVLAGNSDRLLYSDPLMLLIVMDENDNLPVFTQEFYQIALKENTAERSEIITVKAENINDPKTNNSKIAYEILSQEPQVSNGFSFHIDLSSSCNIFIDMVDVNNSPIFSKDRQCKEAAGRPEGKPTVISAVFGIVVGTIGTIGMYLTIGTIAININKQTTNKHDNVNLLGPYTNTNV
ncbi:LOW QUALITY PROTEIN: cadherin-16 [Phoenicopterus ruber ruber]